ncbi:hypothetical protein NP274_00165 [Pseudomonas phage Koomba boorn-mokiny kep-wari Wadjak 1]|nr:hypothetical protein NP274_00165 [Pseudomonas phage Koomba boorn-mokiny kep-wari Wadjak 1]BDR25013.1 hypothetical protein RVBP14_1790 [Pseudomonas phage sp. Brmt]
MTNTFEKMSGDKYRKSRPEIVLRLLIATSFPQSVLADLTFDITKQVGITDNDELEKIANDMRDVERKFDMTDFVRCIDLRRNGNDVNITVNCWDFDPRAKTIEDRAENHEFLANSNITLHSPEADFNDPRELASKLVGLFFRSKIGQKPSASNFTKGWKILSKPISKSKNTGDIESIDLVDAIELVAQSLAKRRFNIKVTTSAILLLDQKRRLFNITRG